jgi:aryl-alcohol dehydrogenase-like predicted oxidoreductase
MDKRTLGNSGLEIAPLVFGGNVFGWTADEARSFAVLDRFVEAGFNAVDTADVYSSWVPGHAGGESESVIGHWLKARPGLRDRVLIFTKTGMPLANRGQGLRAERIVAAVEESLKRLRTDYIDLFFSHQVDTSTPIEETLGAYDNLMQAGKIRAIGASNYDAGQLRDALDAAQVAGLPRYEVVQPEYSLVRRAAFEGPMRDLAMERGLGVVSYFSLASGFLTGKYHSAADLEGRARGGIVQQYMTADGLTALDALEDVAEAHAVPPAAVALAWLMAQPGVTAPIASATSLGQTDTFAQAAELRLSTDDLARLDAASTPQ